MGSIPITSTILIMIKKVVSFGCSFSCWRQNFSKGFVDLVADDLGVPFENNSSPGNSNEAIINEFNKRYHQYELKDSLILFQPTYLTRLSYYDTTIKRLLTFQNAAGAEDAEFTPTNFYVMFPHLMDSDVIKNYNLKQDYFKLYQNYIHDDGYEYEKLLYSLYNIQSSVEKLGSKIIFIYFDTWYKSTPMLNKINFIRFGNELSCLNWAIANELTYSKKDLHLSEEGNEVLAKLINKGHNKV